MSCPLNGPGSDSIQYAWALETLYPPAIWFAKTSLLLQLIRIFAPEKSGGVYWACHILIWGNLAFYVSTFLAVLFECYPMWEAWNASSDGYCVDRSMLLVASSAVNMLSDLLNLLLPVWATWHSQTTPKGKAGVVAIFATGSLSVSPVPTPSR